MTFCLHSVCNLFFSFKSLRIFYFPRLFRNFLIICLGRSLFSSWLCWVALYWRSYPGHLLHWFQEILSDYMTFSFLTFIFCTLFLEKLLLAYLHLSYYWSLLNNGTGLSLKYCFLFSLYFQPVHFYSTFSKISSNLHSLFSINDSALKIMNVKKYIFSLFYNILLFYIHSFLCCLFVFIFKKYCLCLSVLVFSYRLDISTHDYIPRLEAEGLKPH